MNRQLHTRIIVIAISAIAVITLTVVATFLPYETEFCHLCDQIPCHAPCLLNIHTGNLLELSIYDSDPAISKQLAKTQTGGHMEIITSGDVNLISLPDSQKAIARVPIEKADIAGNKFCPSCRDLLRTVTSNYVLVDLFDTKDIKIYDIVEGNCCEMRCYSVSAKIGDDHTIKIIIRGSLMENSNNAKASMRKAK